MEQIGQLKELKLEDLNEKLRIIQRLINNINEVSGEDFVTQQNNKFLSGDFYIETYNNWGY